MLLFGYIAILLLLLLLLLFFLFSSDSEQLFTQTDPLQQTRSVVDAVKEKGRTEQAVTTAIVSVLESIVGASNCEDLKLKELKRKQFFDTSPSRDRTN